MKKYYEEPEVDMVDILVDDIMKVSGETEEREEGRRLFNLALYRRRERSMEKMAGR